MVVNLAIVATTPAIMAVIRSFDLSYFSQGTSLKNPVFDPTIEFVHCCQVW